MKKTTVRMSLKTKLLLIIFLIAAILSITTLLASSRVIRDMINNHYKEHASALSGTATSMEIQPFFFAKEDWQRHLLRMLEQTYGFTVADEALWKEDCVPELCLYLSVQNNVLCGMFVQRAAEHCLELSWLYGKYPAGLFCVLEAATREMERLFPEDTLTFEAINERSEKLAKRLFPKARTEQIYEVGW